MITTTLSGIITLLPFVILAIVYVLLLHPQKSPNAPFNQKIIVGARVKTKSGIIGRVAKIHESSFILETYDGTLIVMHLHAVDEYL